MHFSFVKILALAPFVLAVMAAPPPATDVGSHSPASPAKGELPQGDKGNGVPPPFSSVPPPPPSSPLPDHIKTPINGAPAETPRY